MNVFKKALLQAAENDFSDVPAEDELNISPVPLKKAHRAHALRRALLIAAAIAVLAGSVLAAYVLTYGLGEIEVKTEKDEIFNVQIDDDNRYYQVTFKENFANADAPDLIETYFLPTKIAAAESLVASSCYIERRDYKSYRPFQNVNTPTEFIPTVIVTTEADDPSEIEQVMSKPTDVHFEWDVEGRQITFSQTLATIACDGTPFVNHAIADVETVTTSYRKIQVDEYAVFSFEHDFSRHPDWRDPTNTVARTWYWSDGDYLFSLDAAISEAEMTEVFRSVRPVSESFPYRLSEDNRIEEAFSPLQ
ncbi:MAG: hypothetical protein E7434_09280 [Ruminococcaceae bacterium]|nr:hypothetical protein [Oscillospiraceae bacterium]